MSLPTPFLTGGKCESDMNGNGWLWAGGGGICGLFWCNI
jgi:hypothetical protein